MRHSQQICLVSGSFGDSQAHQFPLSVPVRLGTSLRHMETSCLWVLAPSSQTGTSPGPHRMEKSFYHSPWILLH